MKPPRAINWVIGNAFVLVILGLLFFAATYQWLALGGSPIVTVVLAIVGGWSASAHDRVLRYRQWKEEWDSMNGQAARRGPSLGAVRKMAAVAGWGVGAWGSITYAGDPGYAIPVALFWLGTLVMIFVGIVRLFRRGVRPSRDVIVTVCLGKPAQSPDLKQVYAAIPDYCRQLG